MKRARKFINLFLDYFKHGIFQYKIYFLNCVLVYLSYKMYLQLRFKMCARFVSVIFCILPKTPFFISTYQKSVQILRESVCRPLSNRGRIKNNNPDIRQNIQQFV